MFCRVQHSHLTVIFSTSDHIPTLLKLAARAPILKLIVCMDDLLLESTKILTEWCATQNIQLMELKESM
jgi:long-chain acyl-CoA synthetase